MKRVFLSFLHENIWEVNQFRAVIGNEYVGAMAYQGVEEFVDKNAL